MHIMPRILKWAGLLAALGIFGAAYLPWVYIESRNLTFTGVDTTGSNFGSPAYIHFIFAGLFGLLTLVPRLWAKRANLLVVALNLAWALRNFFMIASCAGGECPVRKAGLLLTLAASFIMLLSALFPDMKIREQRG